MAATTRLGLAVGVGVAMMVGAGVGVAVAVGLEFGDGVAVGVGVGEGVAVGVGVGVGRGHLTEIRLAVWPARACFNSIGFENWPMLGSYNWAVASGL